MQIPGFELLEKLGEGGMATVWKARQVSLDRIVAIKILSARLAGDQEDTARFLKEAQAMAALKHPGIIQVYDANVYQGMYYFVMEFVAGYSVGDWIRRKTRISEGDALLTVDYVADALHYAWRTQRMIHCDIKPDNIMIDDDGTIKVADLGLAKTIGTPGAAAESDDVMGTPNFMSPEQVMGQSDLDYRADIYSLGAMLYHMVTGQLPFKDSADAEAMEKQVTGHLPDCIELNPGLSMGTCWMIEKMLAKDKNNRHADWDAVLSDISRVLKGKMPAGAVLPPGVSTMKRSAKRHRVRGRRVERTGGDIRVTRPLRTSTFAWMPILATALVVTVIGGLMAWLEPWEHINYVITPPPVITAPPVEDPRIAKSAAAFKDASDWVAAHPDDWDGAMRLFSKVAADYSRTRAATMAMVRLDQIRAARVRAVQAAISGLEEKAAALVKEKRYEEAEVLVRDYNGVFAADTADRRKEIAADIQRQAADARAAETLARKGREEKWVQLLNASVDKLITDGLPPTLATMEQVVKEQGLDDIAAAAETVRFLRQVSSVDERLLKTFKSQEGRTVTVGFRDGNRSLKVIDITDGRVRCEEYSKKDSYTVARPFVFDVRQISVGEMTARLGQGSDEEALFRKGISALQAKAYTFARDCFEKTSSALSPMLTGKTGELGAQETRNAAEQTLARLMKACGVNVPDKYDENDWLAILAATKIEVDPKAVEAKVEAYRKEQGNSDFGRDAEKLLVGLVAKAKADAAKAVAAAMAQIDEDAVKKMLLMYNKDLARESIIIKKSLRYPGYSLRIRSEQLVSIGMLRTCGNTITELDISTSKVKDIAAISGTNLRSLDISGTKVANLPMMSGVALERLVMRDVPVKDIGQLSRTRLKELDISSTRPSDLRAIQNLPLESLTMNDIGMKDRDLPLLKNMPLKYLSIRNASLISLSPIQKLSLEFLDLSGNGSIRDFSPISGMPLTALALDDTGIADLGVLKAMDLRSLQIAGTSVRDLSPLAGKDLRLIDISRTRVGSLAPLKGMQLVDVRLSNSGVSDLSPLAGMPLTRFYGAGIHPGSWDPIVGMPITDLVVTIPPKTEVPWFVRTLKSLHTLNGTSWPR